MTGPARQIEFADDALVHARAAAHGDPAALQAFLADAADGRISLRAEVLQIKRVPAGSGVSYGHTYVAERETTLALLDIGYGHGLPRKAGNRAMVTVSGERRPLVGRVAMDACVVDVGDLPVSPGDIVTVFGSSADGAASLAAWSASVGEHPLSLVASLRLNHGEGASLGISPTETGGVQVRVSREAIRQNFDLMHARVAPSHLIAVVKDDAYGHGLDEAVAVLRDAGADFFGALDLATAQRVRTLAPDSRIFAWVLDDPAAIPAAIEAGIELGVTSSVALERVVEAAALAGRPALVHLKADTGLHRAGVQAELWSQFVSDALAHPAAIDVVGVWTHIAEASDDEDSLAIERFREAVAVAVALGVVAPLQHLAASAAAFARADARHDAVRVGAFLYGIAPGDGIGPAELGLMPAMALTAALSDVWTELDSSRASLPLGGVHGLPSDLVGAQVAVRGRRHTIIAVEPLRTVIEGNGLAVGDLATVFGTGAHGEVTLQELADHAGTIGEELVTRLDRSLTRVWTAEPGER